MIRTEIKPRVEGGWGEGVGGVVEEEGGGGI